MQKVYANTLSSIFLQIIPVLVNLLKFFCMQIKVDNSVCT